MAGQAKKNKAGNQTRQTTFGIHWATLFLLLPFIFVWAVIAIPGKHFEFANPVLPQYHQHGWPMVHFERACADALTPKSQARRDCVEFLGYEREFVDKSSGQSTLLFLSEGQPVVSGYWQDGMTESEPHWFKKGGWSHAADGYAVRWLGLLVNISLIGSFLFLVLKKDYLLFSVSI